MEITRFRKKRGTIDTYLQMLIPSEYQECKAFWEYAQRIQVLREYLIKHANERIGYSWFTKALMAIGMRKGLPDYQLPIQNHKYIGLWIEFKRRDKKNNKKDIDQEKWIENLNKIGHYATYAYGCDDAIRIYQDYINNRI
jgi:hypothetical protein